MTAKATQALSAPIAEPSLNGHSPRIPKHFAWVKVPDYDGLELRCWSNASQRVFLDLDSGDVTRIRSAIGELLVETRTVWDGETFATWFDCDGDPLPSPSDPTFLDKVPTELLAMALLAIRRDAASVLPNSVAARKKD